MSDRRRCRRCRDEYDGGYLAWHEDSEERSRKGQKQMECPGCDKWEWIAHMKVLA